MYTIKENDYWEAIKKGLNENAEYIQKFIDTINISGINTLMKESIIWSGYSIGKTLSYVNLDKAYNNKKFKIYVKGESSATQNTNGVAYAIGFYKDSTLIYEDLVAFSANELINGTEKEFTINEEVNKMYIYQFNTSSLIFSKIYEYTEDLKTYINPLIKESRRDTNFVYDNGWYYMLSSGFYESVTFCRSKNLVDWEDTGLCPFTADTVNQLNNMASANQIYAPHLIKINGKWLLYVGLQNKAVVVVQGGENVVGYYSNPIKLIDKDSINAPQGINYEDAFVQRDFDGRLYLFFGTFSCYRVELTDSGLALKSNEYTYIWKGRMGMLLLYRCGYWYLFNVSTTDTYVFRCPTLTGEFVDSKGRTPMDTNGGNLILSASEDIDQPFIMEVIVDDYGQYYAMLDAVVKGAGSSDSARHLYMQRLYWSSDGWPYFEGFKAKLTEIKPHF